MKMEKALAKFVRETKYEDLPKETVATVKLQLLALFGAVIAAHGAEGCEEAVGYVRDIGGKEEATVLMHGGRVPAQMAAFVNSVMGRALDIDDHISPGVHIGSAVIPAALAAAELSGDCSGSGLIAAIAAGTETALRLNLEDTDLDGFDPTGIIAIFASTAAAAKLLALSEEQTLHALALAYNRCGGSFQSNIDGSLAVRVIEGWVAQMGVECARLAGLGITGPHNFLEGVYSFFELYAKEKKERGYVVEDLGRKWHVHELNFKKYPSCGLTQGSTELILNMMRLYSFSAADIEKVEVSMPPYSYKLVGKFTPGNNPKVSAQFSVGYCVANAVVREKITLSQFEPEEIMAADVQDFLTERVEVINDRELCRTHYCSDIIVRLKSGAVFKGGIDVPPGTPENPMTYDEHRRRFYDCVAFANLPWLCGKRSDSFLSAISNFEELSNINELVSLLLPENSV
jgi:2-methylcitrate dehydratase PrpD